MEVAVLVPSRRDSRLTTILFFSLTSKIVLGCSCRSTLKLCFGVCYVALVKLKQVGPLRLSSYKCKPQVAAAEGR